MLGASKVLPLIEWGTMGQILAFSLVAGISIVVLLTVGTQALSHSRRDVSAVKRTAYLGVVVLVAVIAAALIAWGFYLVIHKT